jgi:hypothetical protein
MKYFPLLYRLDSAERYLIWMSNEHDSVVVDADGLVPSFGNITALRQFAEINDYSLETEEPVLHDLDWAVGWRIPQTVPVDCVKALEAWNLFDDIAASIPSRGDGFESFKSQYSEIYDKLFWGNNLPSMTPEGERYVPEWSRDELQSLSRVMTAGLNLFVASTHTWYPPSSPE